MASPPLRMLINDIAKRLRPLIGVRADMGGNELGGEYADLKKTTTGLTLDQCHDLLQLATLKATAPAAFDGPKFAQWLNQTRDDAINTLLNTLDTKFTEAGLTPQMLPPKAFFTGSFGNPSPIVAEGRTVGLEIKPTQTDVTVQLERLTFFATFPEGFKLQLTDMDTGQGWDIVPAEKGNWVDVDIPLLAGHRYTLVYDESELGAGNEAFNTATAWPKPKPGCRGCSAGCLSNFVQVCTVIIDGDTIMRSTDNNHGINLTLSAQGDVSRRLLDNPKRLLSAYKQQMAVTFLSKIAYSRRHNSDTEEGIQSALYALNDTDNPNRATLELSKALSAVVKAMQNEASAALDVNQNDNITWSSL